MSNEKETKQVVVKTVADNIWEEIKDLPISMFSLPNQKVKDHVDKKAIPGDVLFLKPKSSAVIASLEPAIGDKFVVTVASGGFITVERVEQAPIDDEYVYYNRRGKVEKILKKKLQGND